MLKKICLHPFIFFLLVTCVFFWPITLQLFTFKNDALTYYYPIRTLISDALHNGELPLWTPFINMGYPLHADMQSGAWSPIIWLCSFCTNYGLAGFHAEMLFYFSFAGIGFYYLCKQMCWHTTVAITLALCYQFCGFMIDSVQFFVCISAACYLPFIVLFFYRMITIGSRIDAMFTGFFLSLLFTGSYPAMFIITVYFIVACSVFIFFTQKQKWNFIQQKWLLILLASGVFLVVSLPAILSFIQHLPFIDRGKEQALEFVQQNSFVPASIISLISPFSTTATEVWLHTDALMRNAYVGILPLIFIIYGVKQKIFFTNKVALFFLTSAILFFLIAFGHYFFIHQFLYKWLPLINTFRHPALYRLFAIFTMLVACGFSFNAWLTKVNYSVFKKSIKLYCYIVAIISLLLFTFFTDVFFNANWHHFSLKNIYHQANFIQRFVCQLLIVIVLMGFIILKARHKQLHHFLIIICLVDLFLATQINMPITVIGFKSAHEVKKLLNRNEVLFPMPTHNSIAQNSAFSIDTLQLCGSRLPYTKKIGRNDYFITPGNLTSQQIFYNAPLKNNVFAHEVLYFDDTNQNQASINKAITLSNPLNKLNNQIDYIFFSANTFIAQVTNEQPEKLIFLQNYYPGWVATVDGVVVPIEKANITFMAIKLNAGKHLVQFKYAPTLIIYAWYVATMAMFCIILVALGFIKRRLTKNSQIRNSNAQLTVF